MELRNIDTFSVQEVLPYARNYLERNGEVEAVRRLIAPGDKILVHGYSNRPLDYYQAATILEALRRAFKEKYDVLVDVLLTDEKDRGLPKDQTMEWVRFASEKEGYQFYIGMSRGPNNYSELQKKQFKENFSYKWVGKSNFLRDPYLFVSEAAGFPGKLWEEIGSKVQKTIFRRKRFVIQDVNGTDLKFSVADRFWERYKSPREVGEYGHVDLNVVAGIPEPDVEGTIVAYGYHNGNSYGLNREWNTYAGEFPQQPLKLFIEKGKVRQLQGGGKLGTLLEKAIKDGKNNCLADLNPGPGIDWLDELPAIGTHPKLFPTPTQPVMGGKRAGCVHISIGNRGAISKRKLSEEEKRLLYHFDVDLFHPTLTADGEVIISKGWLTALGDSEVIKLAKEFGDPEELLSYAWTPGLQEGPRPPKISQGDFAGSAL